MMQPTENSEQPLEEGQENQTEEEEIVDPTVLEAESVSLEEFNQLVEDLQQSQDKANEYLEGWQRARAEFANYKKRIEREQTQIYQTTAGNIIRRYLDVIDDLERALQNRPQSGDGAAWAEGIELIYRKLLSILESEGVRQMEAEGEMFDPNLHEAISQEESDEHQSGEVIAVVKQGYLLGDRVLRPAMVRVAR